MPNIARFDVQGATSNKRPKAKCTPTFEMSIRDEYVYNIYVKIGQQKKYVNNFLSTNPTTLILSSLVREF